MLAPQKETPSNMRLKSIQRHDFYDRFSFEEHPDIIIKGARDIQNGHKVNLSTEAKGFITHFSIESGNPRPC